MSINTKYQHKDLYNFVKNKEIFKSVTSLVQQKTIIIPHVCNNVNVFSSGFAAAIAQEFPIVKENFHLLGNKNKLGHTQFIEVHKYQKHKIIVANMIAQNGLMSKNNTRPLNYFSLANAMNNVSLYANNIMSSIEDEIVEIHSPKFGSGLAGGNWRFIAELINDIWYNYPVFIYIK